MINTENFTNESLFEVYSSRGISLDRGKGALVWDKNGKEYIDCVGGHGTASVGHCNREVVNAVTEQASRLISCASAFDSDIRSGFASLIADTMPADLTKVFFCNSGTESVEAALKFTRFNSDRKNFISAVKGFHGRTFGAMSATHNPSYRRDFEPLVPGFKYVPFNDFEALKNAVDNDTAGLILESVQGEGGVNPGDKEYFKKVRELCDSQGILMIVDEIQTGFCRTGRMYGFEHFGIVPDIVCLAKAIAGGVPMGAVVLKEGMLPPKGKHGSTFGGNPLACAAGKAAVGYMISHKLADQAERKGKYLRKLLSEIDSPLVREVRGLGLMNGIELRKRVTPYLKDLMSLGLLALPAGSTVLRLLPPLVITDEQIETAVERIAEVLS